MKFFNKDGEVLMIGVNLKPQGLYAYNTTLTVVKNIIIDHKGRVTPRSKENLKELHRYTRRKFGRKNIFDKRTKAYQYLKAHDSEVL